MATTGRPIVNAALDEDTRELLRGFCARYGVTASGLFEAFVRLAAGYDPDGVKFITDLPGWLVGVVTEARSVDAERRGRPSS